MEKETLKQIVRKRYQKAREGKKLPKTLIIDKEIAPNVFTQKRVELLEAILNEKPRSITELAEKTGRVRENVIRDLRYLQGLNLVEFDEKEGRKAPKVNTGLIIIPLQATKLGEFLKR